MRRSSWHSAGKPLVVQALQWSLKLVLIDLRRSARRYSDLSKRSAKGNFVFWRELNLDPFGLNGVYRHVLSCLQLLSRLSWMWWMASTTHLCLSHLRTLSPYLRRCQSAHLSSLLQRQISISVLCWRFPWPEIKRSSSMLIRYSVQEPGSSEWIRYQCQPARA